MWSKTLDPGKYEVRELGDSWALVREGSGGTHIWVLLPYEWEPGVVRWSLVDSDHRGGGRGEVRISARDGGGSRVDALIHHTDPRGVRGTMILLLQRLLGPILFPRWWRSALDGLAVRQEETG